MRTRGGSVALALTIALTSVPALGQEAAPAPAAVAAQANPPAAASVEAGPRPRRRHAIGDSLEGFNRAMFSIHQTLDRLFFRPVAMAYKTVVPKVVRKGIRHFFSNIGEPLVFANDVLQLKPKRAVKTFGRFLINSTVGIGGVLDVAKTQDFRLPHHDNSFGDTLGRYGVGPGPYIFLPLVGPSTLRDLGAGIAEGQVIPLTIGTPFDRAEYRVSETVLTGLDLRVESDDALKALLGSAIDPYATLRSAYLQDRAFEIDELRHRTKRAVSPLDDPLTDPGGAAPAATSAPADDFPADPAPPVEPVPAPTPPAP
ncbi:VacJ family lipoprotein [Sphingomonas sp.]|uniref:MlaA family lipoprotein n=1 Tax=Sphingomonas sp. TaxID=28214 RepID=UPI0033414D43